MCTYSNGRSGPETRVASKSEPYSKRTQQLSSEDVIDDEIDNEHVDAVTGPMLQLEAQHRISSLAS
jgi:hypothetical protein